MLNYTGPLLFRFPRVQNNYFNLVVKFQIILKDGKRVEVKQRKNPNTSRVPETKLKVVLPNTKDRSLSSSPHPRLRYSIHPEPHFIFQGFNL
jgi:hypothetical protein